MNDKELDNLLNFCIRKRKSIVIFIFISLTFLWIETAYAQMSDAVLFQKLNPRKSGIKFKNSLRETGEENMLSFINFYTGSGVGILDVNNDNLPDIFFGGNQVSSRLYLNKGGLEFEDITDASGVNTDRWITGVSVVDINQDGFDDIYLSVSGFWETHNTENVLFVNNGDNTFTERAAEYNLNEKEQTTHTSFFDYDRDGDLDAYLAINPTDFKLNAINPLSEPKINGEARSTDKLYRNEGNGRFTDISKEAGILIEGYSLGVNTSDFNRDGWIDVFVTNDYISNDLLYINNGDGTFTNRLGEYFRYTSFASMGNDAGDFNNDGYLDIISLDMLPESSYRQKVIVGTPGYDSYLHAKSLGYFPKFSRNVLQLNNGNNTFSEIGRLAGIHQTGWSWVPLLTDLDNDGDRDLFVTTGFRRDMGNMDFVYNNDHSPFKKGINLPSTREQLNAIKMVKGVPIINYAFKNNNDLTFSKTSIDWGFEEETYSSGLAVADLDNDGVFEIIINNVGQEASVYENKSEILTSNNYLKVYLKGADGNQKGIGSKVSIYYDGKIQYIDFTPYRGYMSTVERNILFGTGTCTRLDSVEIIWPDGKRSVRYDVKTNTTLSVQHEPAFATYPGIRKHRNHLMEFTEISPELGIAYAHQENFQVDFYNQPLLPHQHSRLGPSIAVSDMNNDELEDFFIGGARGFPATLFFQQSDGTFHSEEFPFDHKFEDMGSLLFDFDGDHDLDLYVVSGGTFVGRNLDLYQDRFYLNDGRGNFTRTTDILPTINSSGSVVTAADFDMDGDLDLFVGGRISPMNYPDPPKSFLLENMGE
jgi:hypothetical protein